MSAITSESGRASVEEFYGWVNFRHEIYLKRQRGESAPWTDDPILRDYYFCNVYRELDKTTVWLRENWREPHADDGATLVFNMLLARFFNWVPTLAAIGYTQQWSKGRKRVMALEGQPRKLFSDAYMIAGRDLTGKTKVAGVCDRLDFAWEHRRRLYKAIRQDNTLKQATWWLQEIPGVAAFMAYEVVTDLRHTPVLSDAADIMTWANPGPGAVRGLQRLYGKDRVKPKNAVELMQELFAQAPEYTALPLEMRDIEMSLCEVDKYLRAKNGEGNVRRYRRPV